MTAPLDLDAIEASYRDPDVADATPELIAEVRKLREIVLRYHKYDRTIDLADSKFRCETCWKDWPCPSAQAAGAT